MEHKQVAEHYNERPKETKRSRIQSPIFHLRSFNNWLKLVLLDLHTQPGCAALDLCCGKGGDLQKWINVGCTRYVGCDIASESVTQAASRFNEALFRKCTFRPELYVANLFAVRLSKHLRADDMFDIVSAQFSIHYAFESERNVRVLLQNVSDRLKPGGFFVGTTVDANVLIRKMRAVDDLQIASACYRIRLDERHADKHFPIATDKQKSKQKHKDKEKDKEKEKDEEKGKEENKDKEKAVKKRRKRPKSDGENGDTTKRKRRKLEQSSSHSSSDDDDDSDDDSDSNDSESNDDDNSSDGGSDKQKGADSEQERLRRNYPYGIRYTFSLDQSVVDCPEYVVHFPTFRELALQYDLELVMRQNFHDFFTEFSSERYPEYQRLLGTMNVVDENGTISPDQWDAIYLYTAFAFRKKGAPPADAARDNEQQPATKRQWDPVDPDEITVLK